MTSARLFSTASWIVPLPWTHMCMNCYDQGYTPQCNGWAKTNITNKISWEIAESKEYKQINKRQNIKTFKIFLINT